jgi:peroxiredoxin
MSSKHPLLGQPAPVLSLPNADGSPYELKPGQGKPMAIFFYPKAGTFTPFNEPFSACHSYVESTQVPLAAQEKYADFGMRSPVC